MCVATTVLSMGTKFVDKEEIVSATCSEDSVTLCLPHCKCSQEKCIVCVLIYLYLYLYFYL